jgi:V/A-type H+-transporting ATPase subunit C
MLSRGDVFNLKTIMRGKHAQLPPAQIIQTLFFVGSFERDYLEKLAHKQDVQQVIDTLAESYPQMVDTLRQGFDEYLNTKNLADLELALEKWYYQQAFKLCGHLGKGSRLMRQFLQTEIDMVNAMTCLRLARVDIEPAEATQFYLPGGKSIKQKDFINLIKMGLVEDILPWLEKRLPLVKDGLSERLALFKKQHDVSLFERLFEANLVRQVRALAIGTPLPLEFNFHILMTYLTLKYNELINLRIILRTIESGLPRDTLKRELIFA